jgi:hypothetical protein
VLPVLVSLAELTDGLAGAGQALVGAGLLVAVPGLAVEGERGGVAGVCLGGLPGGERGFARSGERFGLPVTSSWTGATDDSTWSAGEYSCPATGDWCTEIWRTNWNINNN